MSINLNKIKNRIILLIKISKLFYIIFNGFIGSELASEIGGITGKFMGKKFFTDKLLVNALVD